MREQLKDVSKIRRRIKKHIKGDLFDTYSVLVIINIIFLVTSVSLGSIGSIFYGGNFFETFVWGFEEIAVKGTFMGFLFYESLYLPGALIEEIILLRDLEKQILFINNEEYLNKLIRLNPDLVRDLDNTLVDKILSTNGLEIPFTINTIDKISYRKLKKVYSHVKNSIS